MGDTLPTLACVTVGARIVGALGTELFPRMTVILRFLATWCFLSSLRWDYVYDLVL